MANDPNARFQTAQEMIEALDAFAVRAKLTGSNTAMGRFMTQLFGSKKEPWVEAAAEDAADKTEISAGGRADDDDEADDGEKTTVLSAEDRAQRSASPEVLVPPSPTDAAAWQEDDVMRASGRMSRPALPFESRTPPGGSSPQAAPGFAPVASPMPPPAPADFAGRLGSEPSEVGAKPPDRLQARLADRPDAGPAGAAAADRDPARDEGVRCLDRPVAHVVVGAADRRARRPRRRRRVPRDALSCLVTSRACRSRRRPRPDQPVRIGERRDQAGCDVMCGQVRGRRGGALLGHEARVAHEVVERGEPARIAELREIRGGLDALLGVVERGREHGRGGRGIAGVREHARRGEPDRELAIVRELMRDRQRGGAAERLDEQIRGAARASSTPSR